MIYAPGRKKVLNVWKNVPRCASRNQEVLTFNDSLSLGILPLSSLGSRSNAGSVRERVEQALDMDNRTDIRGLRTWARAATRLRAASMLLLAGVCGCASASPRAEPGDELAELRREQEALREELEQLREEILVRLERLAHRGERAGAETAPPERLEEASLVLVLQAYRESLETEDRGRLEREVYRGSIPRTDARLYDAIFDNADELRVTIDPGGIEIMNGTARMTIDQSMVYRLSRTWEPRNMRLRLTMSFEHQETGWRLVEVRRH